jgi:hypothetical protein
MAGTAGVVQVVLAYLVLVGVVTTLALVPGVDPLGIGQVQGDPASPLSVFVALALGAFSLLAGLAGVRFGGWRPCSNDSAGNCCAARPAGCSACSPSVPWSVC